MLEMSRFMRIAVIPARGGSKRIPRKNIKLFAGKPIIAWSILAAKQSKLFDKIIVSTDDKDIAEVAKKWGALVPFLRPDNLSDDYTATAPVVAHAVSECIKLGFNADWICCIYACAPLIQVDDLQRAVELSLNSKHEFIYPVTEYAHPVQRAMRLKVDGVMEFINPEFELSRTQDLDFLFHDAGQFYLGHSTSWLSDKRMHSGGIGVPIPNWRVADIDTLEDWKRAELIHSYINQ
jgi:pseudaminic acid cytidylyltransferase